MRTDSFAVLSIIGLTGCSGNFEGADSDIEEQQSFGAEVIASDKRAPVREIDASRLVLTTDIASTSDRLGGAQQLPSGTEKLLGANGKSELLFKVKTQRGLLAPAHPEGFNPRFSGGTPLVVVPRVPPPPTRKPVAGYMEEVVEDGAHQLRFVLDVEVGSTEQ